MKIRKTSYNTPDTDEGLILMNARRKEKKEQLKAKRKPQKPSEFIALAEELKKWFIEHTEETSFIHGLHEQNLTWTEIKAWRKENEELEKAIVYCLQLCQGRREKYLKSEGKLASIYLREHPLYVPMLGEYEKELRSKEGKVLEDIAEALKDKDRVLKSIK